MKIISLNANGIRAASRKGLFEWLAEVDADIICLQEVRAQLSQLDESYLPKGYFCQYVDAQKKGYSGVAIFSKIKPNNIVQTLDYDVSDNEARYLQFDFDKFSVISLYLPSGSSSDERQTIKLDFMEVFEAHLLKLQKLNKPFVVCGD